MGQSFLIQPQDNVCQTTDQASFDPSDVQTRRRFLKRSGCATVATLIAWNTTWLAANATGGGSSGSCAAKVAANPNAANHDSGSKPWDSGSNLSILARCTCNPPGNPADARTLTIKAVGSGGNAGFVSTSTVILAASIRKSDCAFLASFNQAGVGSETGFNDAYSVLMNTDVLYDTVDSAGNGEVKRYKYYACLEVTDTNKSSHDAYVKTKAYIYRQPEITTYVAHVPSAPVQGAVEYSTQPAVEQNLWAWKA
jgi:hypothetical protein